MLQYSVWHEPKRDITSIKEHVTSGWDRQSMRDCWGFLDLTSRSFAAVIKELDGDLARVVGTFLDTFCVELRRLLVRTGREGGASKIRSQNRRS